MDEEWVAWELHIQLATRVAVVPLPDREGLLSEALASVDALSAHVRTVLGSHMPHAGCRVEPIIASILSEVGALLSRWSPSLLTLEATRPAGVGRLDHELAWSSGPALRGELADMRARLTVLADSLADVAGAQSLLAAS